MSATEEIWKPIPRYEGYYDVSNRGRVKALARQKRTRWGGFFWLKESIKEPYAQSDGYLQVGLNKDGKKTSHLLHRLVALAFIPGDTSLEVNHKDFVRTNCRADNLEWATRQENVGYSHKNGRLDFKYERGVKTKLTSSDVIELRTLRGLVSQPTLSERYGISVTTVSCIQRGIYWKHIAA